MSLRVSFECFIRMLVCVAACAVAAPVQSADAVPFDPRPDHVILIMLDGFRPDYLAMYGPPNLLYLAREGAWVAEARSVFPSTTTANQTSFVTGAWPARTGIPNNIRYDRASDAIRTQLRDNRVPTIAEYLTEAGMRTASVNHFMLLGRGAQAYVPGGMAAVIHLLESQRPALLVYYDSNPDGVGHEYGPFSPQMRDEVLSVDADIGELLHALDRLGLADRTAIVVASDHGMSPTGDVPVQPSVWDVFRDLRLQVATDNAEIHDDVDLVYLQLGSGHLYWREGKRTSEREAELIAALEAIDGAGVYDATALRALGADPERLGDIAVVPEPGRSLSRHSGGGGMHGTPQESQISLLFWGKGFRSRHVQPRADIVDVVPTVLAAMRMPIPDHVDGEALTGLLNSTTWKSRLGVAGDFKVMDVAASGYHLFYLPANVADGNPRTAWRPDATPSPGLPQYVVLDFGRPREIRSVEIRLADDSGSGPVVSLARSQDGDAYEVVHSGESGPMEGGESRRIEFEDAVRIRYLRVELTESPGAARPGIAEVLVWE